MDDPAYGMNTPPRERGVPPGAQSVRFGSSPTLSVVVASGRARPVLDRCLAAVLPQCRAREAELIVARAGPPDAVAELGNTYPSVLFVAAPAGTPAPALRALGAANALGDIVALVEDDRVPPADWLEQIATARGRRP